MLKNIMPKCSKGGGKKKAKEEKKAEYSKGEEKAKK
jgi:hypothetical protein